MSEGDPHAGVSMRSQVLEGEGLVGLVRAWLKNEYVYLFEEEWKIIDIFLHTEHDKDRYVPRISIGPVTAQVELLRVREEWPHYETMTCEVLWSDDPNNPEATESLYPIDIRDQAW